MTDTCNESARRWIARLQAELAELESHPDYRQKLEVAEGIRQEIARVEEVIAASLRGARQGELA